jgi:hypothetical protein
MPFFQDTCKNIFYNFLVLLLSVEMSVISGKYNKFFQPLDSRGNKRRIKYFD